MICVLAVIGIIAAFVLPAFPHATSRTRLQAFAVEAATMLKSDRTVALQRQVLVASQVDAGARAMRSGVSGRILKFPDDVMVDAALPSRCQGRQVGWSIDFFPTGMSCGGVIALRRPGIAYEIRGNWLTGGVDIVAGQPL
jgi:general secretion pathway protein H